MKGTKQLWILVAVFFGLAVLQPSVAAPAEKYVTFGQTEPLTGPSASLGIANKRITELAVEKINKDGGFQVKGETYKLKVICEDNKGTTEAAVAANNKLVYQDGLKLVMNFLTTVCFASQVVTEPAKVINIVSGLHKDIINAKKPYSFRHFVDTTESAPIQVKWILKNRPNLKTSWMTAADDASGVAYVEGWNAACIKYGIKVLGHDYIARTVTDYYPVLSKIMPHKPDIIGSHGGDTGALFFKQAREKGYKGQFVLPGTPSYVYIKIGGAENLEGMLHIGIDATSEKTPKGVREFQEMYIKKYGEDPGAWSAWQTTPPYLFAQALAKAGTVDDVEKIKAVLEKEWFDTPWGRVKFGGEKKYGIPHQMFHPIFISTVKNGKIVAIDRVDAEEIEKTMNE